MLDLQRDFATRDPDRLKEQLQELERRVERALLEVARRGVSTVRRVNAQTTPAVTHAIDELIVADTTAGNVTIILPEPARAARKVLYVAKAATVNSVVLRPLAAGKINGASTVNVSARGLHAIMSDGVGYWLVT